MILGDADFIDRMQALADPGRKASRETPKAHRAKVRGLAHWLERSSSRAEALRRAHTEGAMTMTAIARELGLSVSRVSRLIARAEAGSPEL